MAHTNILDTLAAELESKGLRDDVNVLIPRTASPSADVVLAGTPALWRQSTNGATAVDSIASRPEVASVQVNSKRRKVSVRLEPSWLEALGTALESGLEDGMRVTDVAAGRGIVVDFCDPNATKAFHVGHLRNLALGNAIAGLASAAGARTTTLSHVGDMGRSMGEALAGYATYREDESPATTGLKSDHFVGECYSSYSDAARAELGSSRSRGSDPALSGEDLVRDDLAEELLSRWAADDVEVRSLWHRMRTWAVDGHEETLVRLGIGFDRLFFESDHIADVDRFVERALASGVLESAADGSVGYATGRDEYPYILLQRTDGQWTQYLRCLALWSATARSLGDVESIQVMGREWLALEAYSGPMLSRLDPDATVHPTAFVVHGMVMDNGEKVSSSKGSPWLVDDLLDELSSHPALDELSTLSRRAIAPELAPIVALTFFLAHPLSKSMTVSPEQLLDERSHPGWTFARGWVEAWDSRHDGQPDPRLDDTDYRFLLVQAQLHRRFVVSALETLDVQPLLRFHAHLCQWFLAAPRTPRVARCMRTVLGQGLSALGLKQKCPTG